jgi:hypothetical protein
MFFMVLFLNLPGFGAGRLGLLRCLSEYVLFGRYSFVVRANARFSRRQQQGLPVGKTLLRHGIAFWLHRPADEKLRA